MEASMQVILTNEGMSLAGKYLFNRREGSKNVIYTLVKRIGLVKESGKRLHLLKRHVPYHESDHVLNLAYNVLAGGEGFEDIELLRQDEGWMDALGAEMIPDPTIHGRSHA